MKDTQALLNRFIFPVMAPNLVKVLKAVPADVIEKLTEIRLRSQQPLLLVLGNYDSMVTTDGKTNVDKNDAYICSTDDIARTLQYISKNSLYAYEQEMKMGFITINGGHRVGLAGQAIIEYGELKTLKSISSLNIRIARQIIGCADLIIPFITTKERKEVFSTLIIAPPRCGKTTLLRDLIRQLSSGNKLQGLQVGLVDERSEIAACQDGVPTVDLGYRVDVLDGCPKAYGMLMLIRSMSPQVIATDEIGRKEDAVAIKEALHAGVSIITTIHGRSVAELYNRPYVDELMQEKFFDRYVILDDKPTVGTLKEVIAAKTGEVLYSIRKEVKICG